MARVLIVGCGCRGQALARELIAAGHSVRGTTRDPRRTPDIDAVGAEPFIGDPDRIATLMEALAGVTILCWLMGSAEGENAAELHAGRLRMMWERLVDTPVRGVLYEAAGSVDAAVLDGGRVLARAAHDTWQIPLELLEADPREHECWLAEAAAAVQRLLGE